MENICMACGIEKDPELFEKYPYPEEDRIVTIPVVPLICLNCESSDRVKQVTVCHECFHKLEPDMWISQKMWEDLNPVIPFDQLPEA